MGMTEALRARGRPRAEENPAPMESVLAAAVNEFAVRGYDGVSVRTLGQALGVSHNLLHQRFGSKEALWQAAIEWAFGPLVAAMNEADDEGRDPLDRLWTSIRTFVRYSADHPDLLRLMDLEGASPSWRLDYLADRFIAPVLARTTELLDSLERQGAIQPIPHVITYYLITSGAGSLFARIALTERLFGSEPLQSDQYDRYADIIADVIVNSLRPGNRDGSHWVQPS